MTASLSRLLERTLDYAGLFPPAALDMNGAVAEFERHLAEDRFGMLASFVCPAARLDELASIATGRDWKLSILATNTESPSGALDRLASDVSLMDAFLDASPGFTLSAFELRVPSVFLQNAAGFGDFVQSVERALDRLRHPAQKTFYELGWSTNWPLVLGVLAQGNAFRGAKIRTGGLEASAFPTPLQVAEFMAAARDTRVPWKATAGLHHPLRKFRSEVGTKMHGFLNVFLGAALALENSDVADLVQLLNEEDEDAFRFSDAGATWRDHVLDRGLISRTRAEFALSFGSCSYREPVEDLKALGLL